jgi:hypothetical protein
MSIYDEPKIDCHNHVLDPARLKAAGVVGVAFNATIHGAAYYADTAPLLARLAAPWILAVP